MNTRTLLACIYLGASGLLPGLAWGQSEAVQPSAGQLDVKPIGKILSATGSFTIKHASAVIVQAKLSASGIDQAKADDPVYRGDLIETGADGALGIVFADGTSFKVSSNARMELNEFVYNPTGNSNSTLISLSKGSFTFVAGLIARSGNMKVDTPVGTMGIRGTAPHVEIADDGTVKFVTLVEEKKSAKEEQKTVPAVAPRQRRAQIPSSPDTSATLKVGRYSDKMLTICRGC